MFHGSLLDEDEDRGRHQSHALVCEDNVLSDTRSPILSLWSSEASSLASSINSHSILPIQHAVSPYDGSLENQHLWLQSPVSYLSINH